MKKRDFLLQKTSILVIIILNNLELLCNLVCTNFQMINSFSDVIILVVVLLNFMYILTCLLLYYCNKLTEDLFCLAEQRNNCLSKKVCT